MKRIPWTVAIILSTALSLTGCSKSFYGGAAAGAVGAGAAYEYQAHDAMKDLEKERDAGKISNEEFERRKDEIRDRSLIQ